MLDNLLIMGVVFSSVVVIISFADLYSNSKRKWGEN